MGAGKSKVGERYSIGIALSKPGTESKKELVIYNDAAIRDFSFDIPMNGLPYGSATIVGNTANADNPTSGTYGKLMVEGVAPGGSIMELPIYVDTAIRKIVSQDMVELDLTFTLGDEKMHGVMEPLAVDGTSVEAMCKLFSAIGTDVVDSVTPVKGANGVSDNMTWRFVDGSISDHLDNAVVHSSIPGDILYWTYDDSALSFCIGTFNVSKGAKFKNFLMYTNDAVMPTASAARKVKGTDTTIWFYADYVPSDLSGTTRESRSPNLVIDSTASGSAKDTGNCSQDCWKAILSSMGASDEYMEDSAFGQQYMVKPFPSNTHKTYAIAPFLRNYVLAEYTKMVRVRLYNHPGPPVGSCVYFYAASPKLENGDFLPDDNYTARYIVAGKRIVKDATVGTGILGKARTSSTADLVTELTMISNVGYAGTLSHDYKTVIDLSNSITESLKKEMK